MLPDPNGRRKRGDRGDLTVPDVAGLSPEEAALAYAEAGWYLLPTDPADIKNPGSVVGGKWHELSSRDPKQIRRWWSANPTYGIALHCGRSGAIVFDLDRDDFATVPGQFVDALRSADAIQLTRLTGDRGHYVFAMPPGESLSNRAGAFAAYGEVRGRNGVVIAAPTPHPDGGNYHWGKTGAVVTPPPSALRECLSAANTNNVEPLTDTAFENFLRAHDRNERPGAMSVVLEIFGADVAAGVSRHYAMVKALGFGYRDAIAGYYPARRLTDALSEAFHAAYKKPMPGRRSQPESREFMDAARYVAAEEGGADPDELRARKDGFSNVENMKLAQRALAPGGRWHPDTVEETLRALPVEPADDSGGRYRLVTARELAEPVEPMRWLVRGVWPERSAGVLAGDKKSMKTWNLQAIALAVAAGRSLFDKYHVTSPGPVLYLAGEGGCSIFANRHQVIAARYDIDPEIMRELPFGVEFGVGALDNSEFIDAVKRHLDTLQPKLVILDPLYAYHPSDVEVSNLYARGPMLANLRMLIGDEAALIVGDHFNKSAPDRLDLDNVAQAGMARAHRQRDGKPCGAWAMRGTTVCRVHGGMAPQVRAKAAERQAAMTNYIANALIDAMDRAGVLRDGRGLPAPWGERLLVALGIIDGHYLEPEPSGARPPREARAYRPSATVDAVEGTDPPDAPADESAIPTAPVVPPPRSLNQEEAAALMRESRLRDSAVPRKGRKRHAHRLR